MQMVRFELGDTFFWFLNHEIEDKCVIYLSKDKKFSQFFRSDYFSDNQKKIINLALLKGEIYLHDQQGHKLYSLDEEVCSPAGFSVDIEDEPIEEDDLPEIISITEKEEIPKVIIPKHVFSNAKLLLENKIGIIKKSINNMEESNENIQFLTVCLKLEREGQNREKIVELIKSKLKVF